MKIIHCKNTFNFRNDILETKIIDSEFFYDEKSDELFFLKSDKGKNYGYSIVQIEKNIPKLKKIYVVPSLRNNGYGTILLKNIIDWLINNNYDKIIVENHKNMNNFLEKQNFIKINNDYQLLNLLEYKREEKTLLFVSKFTIIINIILALLKIVSGNIFKSTSLIADGLNSLSDLITNIIVIIGLKMSRNIEDKEHPFGHGKVESVFSVIIGTFIMVTSLDVIRENFIGHKKNVIINSTVIIISILSLIIKIIQFLYVKYKTKKYCGPLIKSLLKDYKSDIVITLSVILGLFMSRINTIFDTLIGIIVVLSVIKSGYGLIRENAYILMDSQDEKLLESIKNDILEVDEIKNAHDFRMTTSGKDIFITMDIRIDKNITVEEAHNITNKISKMIKHKYDNVKEVFIHVEPIYD